MATQRPSSTAAQGAVGDLNHLIEDRSQGRGKNAGQEAHDQREDQLDGQGLRLDLCVLAPSQTQIVGLMPQRISDACTDLLGLNQ